MKKIYLLLLLLITLVFVSCVITEVFIVSFNTDGGSLIPDQEILKGKLVKIPQSPNKEDHLFDGWFRNSSKTEPFDFNTKIIQDTTIYARWVYNGGGIVIVEDVFVYFSTGEGSYVETQTLKAGELALPPSDPSWDGYEFVGWYLGSELFNFNIPITTTITLTAMWKEIIIDTGDDAPYYKEGVPMIDDAHVIYINLDGFGKYYYDAMISELGNTSVLKQLMSEGVFFEDLRTTYPSITNPIQNAILSGCTSKYTQNVYRYYDRFTDTVYGQNRECSTPRLTKMTKDANIPSASVCQYLAGEDGYLPTTTNALYINADNTIPSVAARGSNKYGDAFARFEQLIKLVKGEPIKTQSGGAAITISSLPRFICIYCDDLDAFGHNEASSYGVAVATTETQRKQNCVNALKEIDQKIGELVQAAKDRGIYNKMTFFLTADHGMQGFGNTAKSYTGEDFAFSKFGALCNAISAIDSSYKVEMVAAGSKPAGATSVVAVGANLNVALTFKQGITNSKLKTIKDTLEKLSYVYSVYTRVELDKMGVWDGANIDLLITPASRYCFSNSPLFSYQVRGQHDSLQPDANLVYGLIWGNGIKKGIVYTDRAYNYEFGVLMASALGLMFPNRSGRVLDIFDYVK